MAAKKPPASSVQEAVERALSGGREEDLEDSVVADPNELEQVAKEASQETSGLDPQKVPTRKRTDVATSLAAREAALAAQMRGRRRDGANEFERRIPTLKGSPVK